MSCSSLWLQKTCWSSNIFLGFETQCNLLIIHHAHIYTVWTLVVIVNSLDLSFSQFFLIFLFEYFTFCILRVYFAFLSVTKKNFALNKKKKKKNFAFLFFHFLRSISGIITFVAKCIFYVIVNCPDLTTFPILLIWFHFRICYISEYEL